LAWFYVTGKWPKNSIDHRDGDRANNRFKNLRDLTQSGNLQNRKVANANNACGLLGVHKNGRRWRAKIKIDYRDVHLGYFDTPKQAHAAYLKAKRELHPFGLLH
jgi:hypothetical protein